MHPSTRSGGVWRILTAPPILCGSQEFSDPAHVGAQFSPAVCLRLLASIRYFKSLGGDKWKAIPLEFMEYGMIGTPDKTPGSTEPGAFGAAWRAVTWLTGMEQGLERVYHFPTWDEFPDGRKLLFSYGWLSALADGLLAHGQSAPLLLEPPPQLAPGGPAGAPLLNPREPCGGGNCTAQQEVWLVGRHIVHNASCQVFMLAAWASGDPLCDRRVANISVDFPWPTHKPAPRVEQYNGGDLETSTYDEAYRRLKAAGAARFPDSSTTRPLNDTCIGNTLVCLPGSTVPYLDLPVLGVSLPIHSGRLQFKTFFGFVQAARSVRTKPRARNGWRQTDGTQPQSFWMGCSNGKSPRSCLRGSTAAWRAPGAAASSSCSCRRRSCAL